MYQDRVDFEEIDFYDNGEIARQYRAPGHPTLVVLRADGEVVRLLPGVSEEQVIVDALEDALHGFEYSSLSAG
jgi:thioredoxin-related protein